MPSGKATKKKRVATPAPAEMVRREEQSVLSNQQLRVNVSSESIIKMLTQQRNQAQDQLAFFAARANDLEAENAALKDGIRQMMEANDGETDSGEGAQADSAAEGKADRSRKASTSDQKGGHRKSSKAAR